jgi:predicted NBD/HSP70 family sugar kinase
MDFESELSEQDGALLRMIRDAGTLSRAKLARDSGLSRPSIAARLRSLCELGLVEEIGRGPSTGGRPPSIVSFVPDAGYVIGVDLGATSADVAISDLSARPVAHVATELDVRDGPEKILGLVCELIDSLLDSVPDDGPTLESVRGLGIGLPGPVEFASGLPVSPPIMPGWDQFPVGDFLFDRYQRPVFVDNDVNLMALGEGCAGVGVGVPNFLYVKLGSGIGCGVICEGKVYRGRNGCAGDIGHIAVNGHGVNCHCGNTGCLEAVAGGRALGLAATDLAASGTSPGLARTLEAHGALSAADLAVAISQADLAATELARTAGAAIGDVLAGLVNFYNPSLVIVGGGVANIGDLLLAAIREAVYRRSSPLATKDLVVTGGALGGRAGVIGATATVLDVLYRLLPTA